VAVALQQVDHGGVERGEPVGGRHAGAERRPTADQAFLQVALVRVEQRDGDRGAVRVAAVEGGPPDAGGPGDVLHAHRVGAAGGEEPVGGGEDLGPVAGGVGALHPEDSNGRVVHITAE
jgi:hypothetical protein